MIDRFILDLTKAYNATGDAIIIAGEGLMYLSILKSRLTTIDVAGFKAWLALNPVTLIYQLATPVPITPVLPNIQTYENYMVLTSTNYPKANLEFNYNSTETSLLLANKSYNIKQKVEVI